MHGPLFLRRSSLPFARLQTVKILHGSFDQALWPPPWPSILRAIKPAVCQASNHGPLFLTHSSLRLAKLQTLKMVRGSLATSMTLGRSSLPFARLQTLKSSAAASTRHSGHLHGPLFLRRSSLPFARLQILKIVRGSFDQALIFSWPSVLTAFKPAVRGFKPLKRSAAASTRHSGHLHGPLILRRSSLPFARLQKLKILCGSFDQALCPPPWPSVLMFL